MNVKAIRLSDKTDSDLLKYVESFESSIHDWKVREEEGSEGEEFDGEGWNLKFWRNRGEGEQKRKEERIRHHAMEKISKIGKLSGMAPDRNPDISRGRSPSRYSRSDSGSRSPSGRRERSYSNSPQRRKRRQSRSPSPRRRSPPPPRDRPQNQTLAPTAPYLGSPP